MNTPTGRRSRHGLHALMARVKVRGLCSIDRRTASARDLIRWKSELLRDLGGEENISAQKLTLLELAVRTRLYVDHLDSWLVSCESLVNRRKKSILPALRERTALVESLARLLSQLGLERVTKPVPGLKEYIEAKGESAS